MIEIKRVSKTYNVNNKAFKALDDVSLTIESGKVFGVIGYSGAGKSTLIRLVNQLTKQDYGDVIIDGVIINQLDELALRKQRQKIGMIFQHFNLLWSRTVLDNVIFPLEVSKYNKQKRKEKALEVLKLVGLDDKQNSYPSQLSGGQKQRVAIARALVNDPTILLCDEATSSLDPETTDDILELLLKINKKLKITMLIISHEMHAIQKICDDIAVIDNGKIVEQQSVKELFSNPKHKTTKKFIELSSNYTDIENILKLTKAKYPTGTLLKLTFLDENSDNPIISKAARDFDLDISVLYGNIDIVAQGNFGNLVIHLQENKDKLRHLFDFFKQNNVGWEVI